jgi:EAL domain-containing protein (putative c-di-GMP-specific phosphodiesterase class I)
MFAAVLGVARAAELQAVAEGVEHPPQLRLLRRLGCEFGQGFIFARPVAADEFARIVGGEDPAAAGLRHAGPVAAA